METPIVNLPCTICWTPIGYTGIVKGVRFSNGEKAQIALCERHRDVTVSEITESKEGVKI